MSATEGRIRTTHVGSLPRPDDLLAMVLAGKEGRRVDEEALATRVTSAVREVVDKQRELGVDVVSDGEMSKTGFHDYILSRLTGFGGEQFPLVCEDLALVRDTTSLRANGLPGCIGPVEYPDTSALERDLANFRAAVGDVPAERAFMNAVTPGQISFNFPNRHYPSHEAYLQAVAEAMRVEYEAIVAAGFTLQVDAPDTAAAAHMRTEGSDVPDFRAHLELALDALNHALANVPKERVRIHVCWGNYIGPHHLDVELAEIIRPLLRTHAQVVSFEAANPRHEHEWEVFRDVEVPDDIVLMPGVIDTKSGHIEHPRLVAQRLERFAGIVGRDRVLAGTDCGFSTLAGGNNTPPQVVWAKLASLVEGANLASRH